MALIYSALPRANLALIAWTLSLVSATGWRCTTSPVRILPSATALSSCPCYPEFNGDFKHEHPEAIQKHLPEIEEFARVLRTSLYVDTAAKSSS